MEPSLEQESIDGCRPEVGTIGQTLRVNTRHRAVGDELTRSKVVRDVRVRG